LIARLPAQPALVVALGLLGLTAVLAVAVAEPTPLAPSPRMALLAVAGALLVAAALASDPAWSFSGAIAASMFSGRWGDLGIPLPVDRLLLALAVAGLVLRLPIARPRVRLRFVVVLMAAAALFAVASGYASGSFADEQGRFALLDRFGIVPFLAFCLAPLVFDTPRRRAVLLGVLTACGAYFGVLALAEVTGSSALVWPPYILDPTIGIHADRARGPFVEAGAFGVALWGCAVAALVYAGSVRRRALRIVAAVAAGLCVLGVLFTLTRAVWLAGGVSLLVTLVATRELHRWVLPAIVGCFLLVAGAIVTVPDLPQRIQAREQTQSSVWDRLNSNAAAIRMLEARPLAGFGWDSFREKSAPYYRIAPSYPLSSVGEVHNVFLSNAAELGLIGSGLWLCALLVAVGAPIIRPPPPGLRAWRAGLLAMATMWVVTANFAPLANVFPNLLLWTWAGVLWVREGSAP
jgi:O-antigen ligase